MQICQFSCDFLFFARCNYVIPSLCMVSIPSVYSLKYWKTLIFKMGSIEGYFFGDNRQADSDKQGTTSPEELMDRVS